MSLIRPETELRALRAISRRLPPVPRAAALVNRVIAPWFNRVPRPEVIARVHGARMSLRPAQAVDAMLLFCPQLYDRAELTFLRRHLRHGDRFADIGAHIGLYALVAAACVGASGRVIAAEPDPETLGRLMQNVSRSGLADRVTATNVGISDRDGTTRLQRQGGGNSGGGYLSDDATEGIEVRCEPLAAHLVRHGFDRLDGMKLDVEGFEPRVLAEFLRPAHAALHPRFIVVELVPGTTQERSVLSIARSAGYREHSRHFTNAWNAILVRGDTLP